ncbi:hypothetical protein D3C77_701800 [compost metagenome]
MPILDAVDAIHGLHQRDLRLRVGVHHIVLAAQRLFEEPGMTHIIRSKHAECTARFRDLTDVSHQGFHHVQYRNPQLFLDLCAERLAGKARQHDRIHAARFE